MLSSHLFFCLPCLLPPFTARWFSPDLMRGRQAHTSAVCISLQWSGSLRVVRLPAGSWHGLPRWWHGLCMRCVVSCSSISFPWLVFFFGALPVLHQGHRCAVRREFMGKREKREVVKWNRGRKCYHMQTFKMYYCSSRHRVYDGVRKQEAVFTVQLLSWFHCVWNSIP